jgi:hypothetical protein
MKPDIQAYHNALSKPDKAICDLLGSEINLNLPKAESKIWHSHPVWFLDGNPVVGYSKLKDSVREGSFKAAEARYTDVKEVNTKDLKRWLKKAEKIQWDYKNLLKRKGKLVRLK